MIFQAIKKGGKSKQLGHNSNFWDLGYPNEMTNEIKIKSTVAKIIRKLDLIMISVYMNQSLILLKDELGWNMEDILYFTINKRSNDSKPDLPNELKDKIRSLMVLTQHYLMQ